MRCIFSAFFLLVFVAACTKGTQKHPDGFPTREAGQTVFQGLRLAPELEEKVLALDPENISGDDVADVLSHCPAPRVFNFDGSVRLVTMESFSRFLILMGYPEQRVRDPETGSYSYGSGGSSSEMAGIVAWYYEKEGMMPMLIGHSQGGMFVIKVLYELGGAFQETIPLRNPLDEDDRGRHAVVDPVTGNERPIVGLKIGFASAVATGRLMRFLLGQWDMIGRLRKIPDSVEEFTGFHIPADLLSGTILGVGDEDRYHAVGTASVRNVILPAGYSHLTVPLTEDLAKESETRAWIDRYRPGTDTVPSPGDRRNILFAAELWYSIKKHWCLELQGLILAERSKRLTQGHAG